MKLINKQPKPSTRSRKSVKEAYPRKWGSNGSSEAGVGSWHSNGAEIVKRRISDNEAMKKDRPRLEYAVITAGLVFLALRNGRLRLRTAWNLEKGWV